MTAFSVQFRKTLTLRVVFPHFLMNATTHLTNAQERIWKLLYEEATDPSSRLRYKIDSDLRSGSVKIGYAVRNNPSIPPDEIPDAIQTMFTSMFRNVPPFESGAYHDRAAQITWVKRASLYFLSNERIRDNRLTIEPKIHHWRLLEGDAPIPQDNKDVLTYLDTFDNDARLNVYDTRLWMPNELDGAHKTFADYRSTSKVKAKCHPDKGHFAKGWCESCYRSFTRRDTSVPVFSPDVVVPTPRWRRSDKSRSDPPAKYALKPFTGPIVWQEYYRTQLQTYPFADNTLSHANFVCQLNTLHQKGRITEYNGLIRKHNEMIAREKSLAARA